MTISNVPVLLFLIPFVAALIVAAIGFLVPGVARWIAVAALGATVAVAISAVPHVLTAGSLHSHIGGWPPPIGIEVLLDPLSAFIAVVVSVVAFIVVVGGMPLVTAELPRRETAFYASMLLLMSGLLGIVITNDMFNLFVQIEVASLAAYALVAAGGRGAPRAGLNYLILGTLGASIYLMGVGFLYAATGTLNMTDIAARIGDADPRLVLVAGLLVISGLGVKMALLPLHVWMPAAYARAPAVCAALMAPLVTKVSAYALIRVMFWVFGGGTMAVDPLLLELVAWAGAAAIMFGGVLAFVQNDLRRMLAYSSVGQMGFVALGAGLASTAGMTGAVVHIAADALMKGALFLAAAVALVRFGVRDISALSRLRGHAPWTAFAVAIGCLSLVGIPPLVGFFGKWYVLSATLADERWAFTAAIFVGSLGSIGYTFRLFEQLFFTVPVGTKDVDATVAASTGAHEGPPILLAACVVLVVLVVGVGLANERIVSLLILPGLPGAAP